jgi:hypothetical protein
MAPAVGKGVAAAIGSEQPGKCDVNFFAPDRFTRNAPIKVRYGYGILG